MHDLNIGKSGIWWNKYNLLVIYLRDWQEGLYTFYVKHDWAIFFLVDRDLTFVIKDK